MTAPVEYIAATIPAKTVRVSNTTLFHIAMLQFGDPLQWVPVAELNDLLDPWVIAESAIEIPPVLPTSTPTGILGL
jgi:hypothetical protein